MYRENGNFNHFVNNNLLKRNYRNRYDLDCQTSCFMLKVSIERVDDQNGLMQEIDKKHTEIFVATIALFKGLLR